jgi:hypothetical protein
MKPNVGKLDKAIRILIAIVLIALFLGKVVIGIPAIIILVIAGLLIITSTFRFCGLYRIFRFSTCSKRKPRKN